MRLRRDMRQMRGMRERECVRANARNKEKFLFNVRKWRKMDAPSRRMNWHWRP